MFSRHAGPFLAEGAERRYPARALAADAPEVWCGGAGFAPGGAATLGEQRLGLSYVQHGKDRRQRGREPKGALLPQDSRAGLQGLHENEWELDFEEESFEEGNLVDDREEEDWWAQGGAGPANALSKSLQKSRRVQPAVEKVVEGAHIGRRKAQGRPPSLTAGEQRSRVSKVSVAVETGGAGCGGGAIGQGCLCGVCGGRYRWCSGAGDYKR
ncbi:hypothetical protein NDU88_007284 [Pleurodeles waltl]|uniref:Uncharacterized protein n=1 Tax=Pleurodeles waltl TaxID=8319 RepID=A0AAV7P0F2_PLEWA|nr:hypothetical protein NDU88_007284 [Pleurodeles waltl]